MGSLRHPLAPKLEKVMPILSAEIYFLDYEIQLTKKVRQSMIT